MNLEISHWVHINNELALRDGIPALTLTNQPGDKTPENFYHALQHNYPKFFKMDVLCKWAWAGAEYLLSFHDRSLYESLDKSKIAVVMMTSGGCIDVDKKYQNSIASIPSPALFVYTLPNIMLGEICIRHGFKGEQLCLVSEDFDANELQFWVEGLLKNRGMEACLCGWANATGAGGDACLFWITKNGKNDNFTAAAMQQIYERG